MLEVGGSDPRGHQHKRSLRRRLCLFVFKDKVTPYVFLFPAIVLLLVFRILPIGASLWGSLHFTPIAREPMFVGLENYQFLFKHDPVFWNSLKVTLKYNLIANPLIVIISLLMALLLNRKARYIPFFRSLYFLPSAVSYTVVAVIWKVMLDPYYGLVNSILGKMGIAPQPFFSDPTQSLYSLIFVSVWRAVGYWMMFYLAGLQSIPQSVYEAASIDGASTWQQTLKITLPLLSRTTAFVLVGNVSFNFLTFAPVYVLTRRPKGATNVLMYESYKSAFINIDINRATAISAILLLIILAVSAVGLRVSRVQYEY